jgi:hypothetical protein
VIVGVSHERRGADLPEAERRSDVPLDEDADESVDAASAYPARAVSTAASTRAMSIPAAAASVRSTSRTSRT